MKLVTAAIASLRRQLPHVSPTLKGSSVVQCFGGGHAVKLCNPWWSNILWFLSGTVTCVLLHNFSYYAPLATHCVPLCTHYAESWSYSMQHLVSSTPTDFGLVCCLLVHPFWEWWQLLHQTVQKRTLDINHFIHYTRASTCRDWWSFSRTLWLFWYIFYVKNTGFLVRGSMAHRMKNILKWLHLPYCFIQWSGRVMTIAFSMIKTHGLYNNTATFSHCSLTAHTHTAVWGWWND